MKKDNTGAIAEQYKKELMKLYGRRNRESCGCSEEIITEETVPEAPNIAEIPEIAEEEVTVDECFQEECACSSDEDEQYAKELEERFPEPDIANIFDEAPKPSGRSDDLGDEAGSILVNVRTGDGALPIEGAEVTVSAIVNERRITIASTVTDISGIASKLTVPAPKKEYSLSPDPDRMPYSLYEITVRAQGFFDARSVDVPVFSGVTSVQDFNMVPTPLYMSSTDETLTYYNQEPKL